MTPELILAAMAGAAGVMMAARITFLYGQLKASKAALAVALTAQSQMAMQLQQAKDAVKRVHDLELARAAQQVNVRISNEQWDNFIAEAFRRFHQYAVSTDGKMIQ